MNWENGQLIAAIVAVTVQLATVGAAAYLYTLVVRALWLYLGM